MDIRPSSAPIPSPSEARAPAFGVSIALDCRTVRVMASDSGGRGHPHLGIFVPVERDGEKLRMLYPDEPFISVSDKQSPDNPGGIFSDPISGAGSPYLFEIPLNNWPKQAKLVLLLLLYVQAEGIGGQARAPGRQPIMGGTPEARAIETVKYALACDTVDELRGGLISGQLPNSAVWPQDQRNEHVPTIVRFAVASCHYPSDILDRMPDGEDDAIGPADASLLKLGGLLGESNSPTLLLLAGDQVYLDLTAGLFDPAVLSDYFRIPYERRGQSRGAQVIQRLDLRVEMMLDDHELRDNWAPNDPQKQSANDLVQGKAAYFKYQRPLLKTAIPTHVWRDDIIHCGLPFFLGDFRTEREGRTARDWRTKKIMNDVQFNALCHWLLKHEYAERPKFVLTPSAFLPRRVSVACDSACGLRSDAWEGYPYSQHKLMQFVCDREIKNLVFLSGDEHISSMTTATVRNLKTRQMCKFHSIHSSALYAPYPFINAGRDDFQENDCFYFPDPETGPYCCEAKPFFPEEGDGFAVVSAHNTRTEWRLTVQFYSGEGPKGEPLPLD